METLQAAYLAPHTAYCSLAAMTIMGRCQSSIGGQSCHDAVPIGA